MLQMSIGIDFDGYCFAFDGVTENHFIDSGMQAWVLDNCKGKIGTIYYDRYKQRILVFKSEIDAMAFKLKWR